MNLVKKIEKENEMGNYTLHGVPIWLGIRGYLYSKTFKKVEPHNLSLFDKLRLLSSVFVGFSNYFKKFDYWFFSSSLDRIEIDNLFFDKQFDYPAEYLKNSLVIEAPIYKLKPSKKIYSKNRISGFGLIFFQLVLSKFIRVKNKESYQKVQQILTDNDTPIDVKSLTQKIIAQYYVMKFLLRFKKPKVVFLLPSYTKHGFVLAFKEKNIKVIEIQHGVINKEHYGYNLIGNYNNNVFPDFLLTWGQKEVEVFENNDFKVGKVIPIGSYIINQKLESFIKPDFIQNLQANYKKTVAVSLQDCSQGEKLIPILIESALLNNSILYLVKNRRTPIDHYKNNYTIPENMVFLDNLDVYQTIMSADFHLTAYSSCLLESPALGVPNIAVNIENMAKKYYKNILTNPLTTIYLNTSKEIVDCVEKTELLPKERIKEEHKKIIVNNYTNNWIEFAKKHVLND